MNGSSGTDTVSHTFGVSASAGVNISLAVTTGQSNASSGIDTLTGIENLTGSNYADKLTGNTGSNSLSGGAGNDTVSGGSGNDTLVGGADKDSLTSGVGNDVFDFNAASESGTANATWDIITDFIRGQDRIDLSSIDANTATTANDAFTTIIAISAAYTAAGQLKFASGVLYGNIDADAEFAITLTGVTTLSTGDILL
jgi:Ca2+-binding RTX toxin-like protein